MKGIGRGGEETDLAGDGLPTSSLGVIASYVPLKLPFIRPTRDISIRRGIHSGAPAQSSGRGARELERRLTLTSLMGTRMLEEKKDPEEC